MLLEMLKDEIKEATKIEHLNVQVNESRNINALLTIPCFKIFEDEKDPLKAAKKLKDILDKTKIKNKYDIKQEGPYINFYPTDKYYIELLKSKLIEGKKKKERIVIDYSSPNIGKPFHVGHFRNTVFGWALVNIYKTLGYDVITDNHLGDWGTQFGKLIYAYKVWGKEEKLKKEGTKYLLELYVKFHKEEETKKDLKEYAKQELVKLLKGDKENLKLWKMFVEINMKYFKDLYKILGVEFDYYLGESFYVKDSLEMVKELLKKGIAKESDGAVIIPLEKYNLPNLLILKGDGATLYATHDLACLKYRKEKMKADKIIYIVGSEQTEYFKQIFKAAEIIGWYKEEQLVHISYGLVDLPEGKMSTRKGNIILVEDIINKSISLSRKLLKEKKTKVKDVEEAARVIGLGVVKFTMLSQSRNKSVTFDWNKIVSFEGDTGPYIQYTYSRGLSILKKAADKENKNISLDYKEKELINKILVFEKALQDSLNKNDPNVIATYLIELCHLFNSFYQSERIIGSEKEWIRCLIVKKTTENIEKGLKLLGIEVLEKM